RWENPLANRQLFAEKINALKEKTDLVLLPEMFNTGFSMNVKRLAEKMNGETMTWMKNISQEKNAALCGSLIIEENGKYFNGLIWMQPDGNFFTYDKRHLFGMGDEDKDFSRGEKRLVVEWKGWKVCPLICYDLRFPVWSRQQKN